MRALLIVLLCLACGCTSARKDHFEGALREGRCEDALENLPENDSTVKLVGRTQRAAGTVLSYTATGAAYAADVAITVAGGAVIFTVLCAPVMALGMVSTGSTTSPCIPADLSHVPLPHNGRDVYRGTEEMRCPDLTALTRNIRRVAACQEASKTQESLTRAETTLRSVAGNDDFMSCITSEERSLVNSDLYRVREELRR